MVRRAAVQSCLAVSGSLVLILLATLVAGAQATNGPKFYPDDPIERVVDSQDASAVHARELDLIFDTLENSFMPRGDRTPDVRAQNLNTVDEVPDSNWFTNRIGTRPLSVEDVLRGTDRTSGPAPGTWTIMSAKTDGIMPGFTIRDSAGETWFLKFDPPGYRAMATGSEIVVAKLLWAIGFYVPEIHLAALRPEQLVIDDKATITPPSGRTRPFKQRDINAVLRQAHRDPDGSYRVIASRQLEGRPVGGFLFYGTRPDDPNDLVAHEHRRELRAYGTFAAWLNHVDSKSINTLDTVVEQDGRRVVRHHLIDFGSTLGSAGTCPREAFEGWKYLFDGKQSLKRMGTFGFIIDGWRTLPLYKSSSVGAFPRDNTNWDPEAWKARYPNTAFSAARWDDKFWAARRLQAFTDEMLTAVVRLGQFDDPESEEALTRFLVDRRDAIVRRYLPGVNPVIDLQLTDDGSATALEFRNAAVDAEVAAPPTEYVVQWGHFNNLTHAVTPIGRTTSGAPRVAAPPGLPDSVGTFIRAEISARGGPASWEAPAHAYFVREANGWRLVGFERVPTGNPPNSASN
jgi:hypothetical protein